MIKIKPVFYDKQNAANIVRLPSLDWRVIRYSHHVWGGPKSGLLRCYGNEMAVEQLASWLGYPLILTDEQGRVVWWGYVDGVDLHLSGIVKSVDFSQMWNRMQVLYSDPSTGGGAHNTAAADNTISQAAYAINAVAGIKTLRYTAPDISSLTTANALRDQLLAFYKYPRVRRDTRGEMGGAYAEFRLAGYYERAKWRYYNNTGTATVDTATQIAAIVTNAVTCIAATDILLSSGTTTGITSVETRDGAQRAYQEIESLLNIGGPNGRRLLAQVTQYRRLIITEEPTSGEGYDLRYHGPADVRDATNNRIMAQTCPVGRWIVDVSGATPISAQAIADPNSFFIEFAEYDCQTGRVTLTPRGAIQPGEFMQIKYD